MSDRLTTFNNGQGRGSGILVPTGQTFNFADPRNSVAKRDREMTEVNFNPTAKGTYGTTIFAGVISEEYLEEWKTPMKRCESINRMLSSDATVKALQHCIELPIRSAFYDVTFTAEADRYFDSRTQETICSSIKRNLFEEMRTPWDDFLRQAIQACFYGFYPFEILHMIDKETDQIKIKDLSPRLPKTLFRWELNEEGELKGMWQKAVFPRGNNAEYKIVLIPYENLCLFTYRQQGSNFEGESILRACFKHWYFKDKIYIIQGIGIERNAVGEPIFVLPPQFTAEMKTYAESVVKSWRVHEEGGAVLPPGAELKTYSGTLEAGAIMYAIQHHDTEIAKSVLAHFINLGTEGRGGAYSLGVEMTDFFMLGLKATANWLCDTINKQVIKPLLLLNNPDMPIFPRLIVKELGRLDRAGFATMLSTLIQAKLLTPDKDLEKWTREIFEIPPIGEVAVAAREGEAVQIAAGTKDLLDKLYAPSPMEQQQLMMQSQQQMQQQQMQYQAGMQKQQAEQQMAMQQQQMQHQQAMQQGEIEGQQQMQQAQLNAPPQAQQAMQQQQMPGQTPPVDMAQAQNPGNAAAIPGGSYAPPKRYTPSIGFDPTGNASLSEGSGARGFLSELISLRDELINYQTRSIDGYVDGKHIRDYVSDLVANEARENGQLILDRCFEELGLEDVDVPPEFMDALAGVFRGTTAEYFNGSAMALEDAVDSYKFKFARQDPTTGMFAPREGGPLRNAVEKAAITELRRSARGVANVLAQQAVMSLPIPDYAKRFTANVVRNTAVNLASNPIKEVVRGSIDKMVGHGKGGNAQISMAAVPQVVASVRKKLPAILESSMPDVVDHGQTINMPSGKY